MCQSVCLLNMSLKSTATCDYEVGRDICYVVAKHNLPFWCSFSQALEM